MKEKIPASERWKSILGPVVRIVFAIFLVGVAVAVAQVAVKLLRDALSLGGAVPTAYYLVYLIVSVLAAYLTYWAYVRGVEKRSVTELSGAGAPRELGIGALVGLGMVVAIVGTLWLLGYYQITGVNAWTVTFVLLANDGAGAFVEEIILRGIIFRVTEEKLGTWMALGISIVLFSLLHLTSPGATVMSTLVVGLEAGILLSAAYVLTRRLWLAIGIHFAWDFSQDYVFGVSRGADGLVRAQLTGPASLSGGSAGIEGSILALILCLLVSAYLLVRSAQKGNIVRPSSGGGREKDDPVRANG